VLFGIRCGSASAVDARPDIVILDADDMGCGDLAIQDPDSKIPTPSLDRLAREGMRFTDAHGQLPACSTRGIITGRTSIPASSTT
jgi:arylsulfatase A-like enzyme